MNFTLGIHTESGLPHIILHPEPIQRTRPRENPFRHGGHDAANQIADEIQSIREAAGHYDSTASQHLQEAIRLARLGEQARQQADALSAQMERWL